MWKPAEAQWEEDWKHGKEKDNGEKNGENEKNGGKEVIYTNSPVIC